MASLIAYQVGDTDIVLAHNPQEAIEVLCKALGEPIDTYDLNDVEPVTEGVLDSMVAFDIDEGKLINLETSLRQDISLLTEPQYILGW